MKADRLDVLSARAGAMIAEAPLESIVVPKTKPDANSRGRFAASANVACRANWREVARPTQDQAAKIANFGPSPSSNQKPVLHGGPESHHDGAGKQPRCGEDAGGRGAAQLRSERMATE